MTAIRLVGTQVRALLDGMAPHYGNIDTMTLVVTPGDGDAAGLQVMINGNRVPVVQTSGTVIEGVTAQADPVSRLREIADQYRTGQIRTNPMDALREVVELLDPAYEQLLRS